MLISLLYACQCNHRLIKAKNELLKASGKVLPGNKVIIYFMSITVITQLLLVRTDLRNIKSVGDNFTLLCHILIILSNLAIAQKATSMTKSTDKLTKLFKENKEKNSA